MDRNRPRRSATKNCTVVECEEDAGHSFKRRKFDHKRNAGPGNRPPLISDGNNEPEEEESGSEESDFETEQMDSESDSDN